MDPMHVRGDQEEAEPGVEAGRDPGVGADEQVGPLSTNS
jgi:hypothetical protein